MTTDLIVDIGTETATVTAPGREVEVSAPQPTIDLTVPGQRGPTGHQMVFVMFGAVVPKEGTVGFYPRIPGRIVRVTGALTDQASGATRPNIKISGTTVFTNPANRPNLNGTGRHFSDAADVEAGVFGEFDYMTCSVDSAGTGAQDLIVTVEYEPT